MYIAVTARVLYFTPVIRALTIISILVCTFVSRAQMCPGGGLDFANAVVFDPSWIYGCNTGTSCNGGVNFDNRTSCEPTTSLDACAPTPSCGTAGQMASDVWFKFYASNTTVTLSSFQNTSFVIAIQAFSGGTTCGSLTEIGCAVAGGPSSGVNLTMTGLTVGQLYYYRVFGNASPAPQRTGLYCFCGTTGVENYILPTGLTSFTGTSKIKSNLLRWSVDPLVEIAHFEIQKSADGINFYSLGQTGFTGDENYIFTDHNAANSGIAYYRLKVTTRTGAISYSSTIALKPGSSNSGVSVSASPGKPVVVETSKPCSLHLYNAQGQLTRSYRLPEGRQELNTNNLANGIYFLLDENRQEVHKFIVSQYIRP